MKKYICVILVLLIALCSYAHAASGTVTDAETTEETMTETAGEITETEPPADTDGSEDTARTFMNINIYMFISAVVLVIICTVVYFVMKSKKKKANYKNND